MTGPRIPPGAQAIVDRLLGCRWGREFATLDDLGRCEESAVQIVVVHPPDGSDAGAFETRLCQRHLDRLALETVPHRGGADG
jgi:hypothetical protein